MLKDLKKYSLAILIVAACSICGDANVLLSKKEVCPEICPALYAPLCAWNGEFYTEFGNDCVLKVGNCQMERSNLKTYAQVDMDWCRTKAVESINSVYGNLDLSRPECLRACTMIYAPVCASNGQYRATVSSQCILDTYNCVLGLDGGVQTFRVLAEGSC